MDTSYIVKRTQIYLAEPDDEAERLARYRRALDAASGAAPL